ncbi:transmembrane protein (macronuclear) [Tetrahymena thermophila SB210]|uniref:Transmembrane protein n=1 Tax=Tetrahymena thermophila (strain SB210) TaxID=312017 RepID=Q24DS7_TETTS|nr:transmembrane protein [Tetrahymena thermophila SB210]EAS05913.2 transmembrane protein [Tetrahymena thermophila SB210]|eukprot:XP_001026158.2 transmembrane protein [Tetrahymena thermophila SB210]
MKKEAKQEKIYTNFQDFYPFYLSQHSNIINRRLHYIGTTISMMLFVISILLTQYQYLPLVIVSGYAFAWVGHFFFEKNKPATFKYPVMSFMGDFKMWYQITTKQIKW